MSRLQSVFISRYNPFFNVAVDYNRIWSWRVKSVARIFIPFLLLASTGCEKKESSLIDSTGTPPTLISTGLSPSSINSDSINIGSSRNPDDVLSLSTAVTARVVAGSENPISSVFFVLRNPSNSQVLSSGELLDNGSGMDSRENDGVYNGRAAFQIKRVEIGTFVLEVSAEGNNGLTSNTVLAKLSVFRGNKPPILSTLEAPDTLTLANQSQLLTLRILATDPDGLTDVARVVFNSYKPDGSASSGNPFQMYDDGSASHGDVRASDGTYSLTISLPSNTQPGVYRFEFQAFDRSNEASSIFVHSVTVKQ